MCQELLYNNEDCRYMTHLLCQIKAEESSFDTAAASKWNPSSQVGHTGVSHIHEHPLFLRMLPIPSIPSLTMYEGQKSVRETIFHPDCATYFSLSTWHRMVSTAYTTTISTSHSTTFGTPELVLEFPLGRKFEPQPGTFSKLRWNYRHTFGRWMTGGRCIIFKKNKN